MKAGSGGETNTISAAVVESGGAFRFPQQESFLLEYFLLFFFFSYVVAFFVGKRANKRVADAWLERNLPILQRQFSRVAHDDGTVMRKLHHSTYVVYATGSRGVRSAKFTLNLRPRQDLLSVLWHLAFPQEDTLATEVRLLPGFKPDYVFAVVQRRKLGSAQNEFRDLKTFARPVESKLLPASHAVLTDAPDLIPLLLTSDLLSALDKYGKSISMIHTSDRYPFASAEPGSATGPLPEASVLHVVTALAKREAEHEDEAVLLRMIFYLAGKLNVQLSARTADALARLREKADFEATAEARRAAQEKARLARLKEEQQRKEAYKAQLSKAELRKYEAKEQEREAARNFKKMRKVVRM